MGVFDVLVWIALLVFIFWAFSRIRENFRVSLPSALGGHEVMNLDSHSLSVAGKEIGSITPFTCPTDKPDLDGGLCYEKCKTGYHGVGPVCWIDSHNRGVGTPVGLEPCPSGWSNDGLTCREPISSSMEPCPEGSRDVAGTCWGRVRNCVGGCGGDCGTWRCCGCSWSYEADGITKQLHERNLKVTGGKVVGRLDKGGVCPNTDPGGPAENTEKLDGLCYKKCPADKPFAMPAMPYLCYAGGDLSYGRGVGKVPSLFRALGKYPIL